MDRQEQRKRAFSQAFQRMNQPRHGDHNAQPAKRILSYPLGAAGLYHQMFDQENEAPLDLDSRAAFDETPETQICCPPPVGLQYADSALYDHLSPQDELHGNVPGPELKCGIGNGPPSLLRDNQARFTARHKSLPTPTVVRGQSMFIPSLHGRPGLYSWLGDSVDSHTQAEAELSPMSETSTAVGPLTPGALKFGDLTLNSQGYSLPSSSPLQCGDQGGRATVRVLPVSSFARHFSKVDPNEVIILFEKGKSLVKVDKYPLCSASRFFAQLLEGPFLDHGFTNCIRLLGDFPYAITTMLHFIDTGNYMFDQRAFTAYPLLTALDFHIHIYSVGSKYGFVALQNHAIDAYLCNAEHELKLSFLATSEEQLCDAQIILPGFPVMPPSEAQVNGETVITPTDRFLNSLVLLWINTQSRFDALRKAVLELIKRNLSKLLRVSFFVTLLQEFMGFGDDVVASLGEDGFEVKAYLITQGARVNQTVRFEV